MEFGWTGKDLCLQLITKDATSLYRIKKGGERAKEDKKKKLVW